MSLTVPLARGKRDSWRSWSHEDVHPGNYQTLFLWALQEGQRPGMQGRPGWHAACPSPPRWLCGEPPRTDPGLLRVTGTLADLETPLLCRASFCLKAVEGSTSSPKMPLDRTWKHCDQLLPGRLTRKMYTHYHSRAWPSHNLAGGEVRPEEASLSKTPHCVRRPPRPGLHGPQGNPTDARPVAHPGEQPKTDRDTPLPLAPAGPMSPRLPMHLSPSLEPSQKDSRSGFPTWQRGNVATWRGGLWAQPEYIPSSVSERCPEPLSFL